MSLATATRSDWKLWPEREDVTYRVVSPLGTYTPTSLTATGGAAKKRALKFAELAASNGVYCNQDRAWLIPDEILSAASITPKLGDKVRDSGSTDWTVLSIDLGKFGNTWKLLCRDLVLVAGLRDEGILLRQTPTQDSAGRRVPNYDEYATEIPCRVQLASATLADDGFDGRVLKGRHTAYLDTRVVPQHGDIFQAAGVRYNVVGWSNLDRIDQLLTLDLEDIAEAAE